MREGRRHVLLDLWVENPDVLKWSPPLRTLLMEAARASGATILADRFHQFKPYGVTGILLLAESHLSIHTWPEDRLATFDVFTCGSMDTDLILEHVRAALTPTREQIQAVQRGIASQSASQ